MTKSLGALGSRVGKPRCNFRGKRAFSELAGEVVMYAATLPQLFGLEVRVLVIEEVVVAVIISDRYPHLAINSSQDAGKHRQGRLSPARFDPRDGRLWDTGDRSELSLRQTGSCSGKSQDISRQTIDVSRRRRPHFRHTSTIANKRSHHDRLRMECPPAVDSGDYAELCDPGQGASERHVLSPGNARAPARIRQFHSRRRRRPRDSRPMAVFDPAIQERLQPPWNDNGN